MCYVFLEHKNLFEGGFFVVEKGIEITRKQNEVSNINNKEKQVSMSNALIRAAHGLTLSEKRLVVLAISKLNNSVSPFVNQLITTKVFAHEYAKAFDVSMHTAYDELKSSAKNLYQRSICFYEAASERKSGKKLSETKVMMRWVGVIKYNGDAGGDRSSASVELQWIPQLLEHLLGLGKVGYFTSYQLRQTTALRSTYSWKLMELLMRFKKNGWAYYDMEDFCESMEASEKQRANFANIRRHIIEPAVKELEGKDDWFIEWKPVKTGRKVTALQFKFVCPKYVMDMNGAEDPNSDFNNESGEIL